MKNNMTVTEAITHSIRYDTIARVSVADKDAANASIAEAKQIAEASDLDFNYTDSNEEGYDAWASKEDSKDGDMEWRITVAIM